MALALMVGLPACGGSGKTNTASTATTAKIKTHSINGTIISPSIGCTNTTAFDAGQPIVVRDGTQKVLGTGVLASPHIVPRAGYGPGACAFDFTMADLPEVPVYQFDLTGKPLSIGQNPIPLTTAVTLDQLQQRSWSIQLPFFQNAGTYTLGEPGKPGLPAG